MSSNINVHQIRRLRIKILLSLHTTIMSSNHIRSFTFFLLFCAHLLIHLNHGNLVPNPAKSPLRVPPSSSTCDSTGAESQVLCEASAIQEASIAQVIAEDETARSEQNSEPPIADDVWNTAYKQWVNPDSNGDAPKHAREKVGKRYGGNTENDSKEALKEDMEKLDDDEATKISAYAKMLEKYDIPEKDVFEVLEEVEMLCASGDNGKQMAAVGGVRTLVRMCGHSVVRIGGSAMRSLASCAQNNAAVVDVAVAENAVEGLMNVALESKDEVWLRAAALRALVAVADGKNAGERLWKGKSDIVAIVMKAVGDEGKEVDARRCLIRALALSERCLIWDKAWAEVFKEGGLIEAAEFALGRDDVDVREGAARVLRLLR